MCVCFKSVSLFGESSEVINDYKKILEKIEQCCESCV